MMKRCLFLLLSCVFGAIAWAQSYPTELNITYVKAPFNLQNMVIKERQLLEKEFARDAIKINWIPIKAGLNQVRGLMAGDIDMVSAMNTSTLLISNAAGNRILIVDTIARPNDIFAIVGQKGRSIESVADLKGKRIVGPKGTVLHHILAVALEKHGMSVSDVDFTNMNLPASLMALTTGKVDAALLNGAGVLKTERAGYPILTRATGLVDTHLVLAVSEKFAQRYPQVVSRVRKVNQEVFEWIQSHRQEALAIGAKELGLNISEAERLALWANHATGITPKDYEALEVNQAYLVKEKMMKQKVEVKSLFFH